MIVERSSLRHAAFIPTYHLIEHLYAILEHFAIENCARLGTTGNRLIIEPIGQYVVSVRKAFTQIVPLHKVETAFAVSH